MVAYEGARIEDGLCTIDSWENLKKELRDQFLPENAGHIAMEKLVALKHTRGIRDYVRQFSTLLLDIRDTSEKDKVFFFINGLQPLAKTKLHENKVQTLAAAMACAERLLDYGNKVGSQRRTTPAPNIGCKTNRTEVTTYQADGRIDLLRTTKQGHLENLTIKGTTRRHLYNACCVKVPTKYPTVLIGPLSLRSKCPFKREMTQGSRLC